MQIGCFLTCVVNWEVSMQIRVRLAKRESSSCTIFHRSLLAEDVRPGKAEACVVLSIDTSGIYPDRSAYKYELEFTAENSERLSMLQPVTCLLQALKSAAAVPSRIPRAAKLRLQSYDDFCSLGTSRGWTPYRSISVVAPVMTVARENAHVDRMPSPFAGNSGELRVDTWSTRTD